MKSFVFSIAIFLFLSQNLIAQYANHSTSDHYTPFIENKGQWDNDIVFRSDFNGGRIFLHKNKMRFGFLNPDDLEVLSVLYHDHSERGKNLLEKHVIHGHIYEMEFVGANKNPELETFEKQSNYNNYFIGNDKSKWAGNVGLFGQVLYKELWDGINLKMKEEKGQYEYDFIVKPGADIGQIKLSFKGQNNIEVKDGKLLITTSVNTVIENAPYVYQQINEKKHEVACYYKLEAGFLSFEFPEGYNAAYEMIIDPILIFSTYSGSTADNWGYTATYDTEGNYYGGSIAFGIGYPTTPGAFQESFSGGSYDITLTKYNQQGTAQVYSTYLGGNGDDIPESMIVNNNGSLVVFGTTNSIDFPVTGSAYSQSNSGEYDIFITTFNTGGSGILGSTYIGGSSADGHNGGSTHFNYGDFYRGEVMVDDDNNVYISSSTNSNNFPTTPGSTQPNYAGNQDAVVFKMNPGLSSLLWSTYIGGNEDDAGYSINLLPNNNIIVCGGTASSDFPTTPDVIHPNYIGNIDGFIVNINNNNGSLNQGSYLGTASYDQAYFLDIDSQGDVYVFGQTKGAYPVSPEVYSNINGSQFIHKISPDLSTSILSTVIGSGESTIDISPTAFSLGLCQNIYLSGWGGGLNTEGSTNDLPVSPDAFQTETDGSGMYFMVLEKDFANLLYATHFGGSGLGEIGEHVDGGNSRFDENGTLYQAVCACTSGMPTTPGAWSQSNGAFCNLGSVKMKMELDVPIAELSIDGQSSGCIPFEVTFNNIGTGMNFIWDFGDGSPIDTSVNPIHTYTETGEYEVSLVAIDSSLCNIADTAYATIIVGPPSQLISGFKLELDCDNLQVTAISHASGLNGILYEWLIGGFSFASDSIAFSFNEYGVYDITLYTSDTICSIDSSLTKQIYMDENIELIANFNYTPDFTDSLIYFANNGTTDPASSYYWDFGDGNVSSEENPVHFYDNDGMYNVTEIVTSDNYCNYSDTITLPVFVEFGLTSISDLDREKFNVFVHQNTLKIRSSEKNKAIELTLYNTNGRKIKTYTSQLDNTGSTSINLPALAKGIYLVHYKSKNLQKVVRFVY